VYCWAIIIRSLCGLIKQLLGQSLGGGFTQLDTFVGFAKGFGVFPLNFETFIKYGGDLAAAHGGFAVAHGGFAIAHGGFATAHEGFAAAHGGFVAAHGGFAGTHGGFATAHGGFAGAHGGSAGAHGGFPAAHGMFAVARRGPKPSQRDNDQGQRIVESRHATLEATVWSAVTCHRFRYGTARG
jgi:hypothetical protein